MMVLFSAGLAKLSTTANAKILLGLFLFLFAIQNITLTKNYLTASTDGRHHITLGNQLDAVNFTIDDAQGENFNVD